MKKTLQLLTFFVLALFAGNQLFSQNVTITDDPTYSAHSSAMLDVKSDTKGFLMSRADTASISNPAKGLMVYDSLAAKIYFFDGNLWVDLATISAGSNDSIWLENTVDNYVFLKDSTNKVGIGTSVPEGKLEVRGVDTQENQPLFVVKDDDGNEVFVVYSKGVIVYVDSADVSTKSTTNEQLTGFRVGKRTTGGSKGFDNEYFSISPSSEPEVINPSEARILWYPHKEAFMAGRVLVEHIDSVGTNSWASGFESKSIGNYSQALGYRPRALGHYSTAIGNYALAEGDNSFALGDSAVAGSGGGAKGIAGNAYAFGKNALATGDNSYAIGLGAEADNTSSFAIGFGAVAHGEGSFAIGSWGRDSLGNPILFPTAAMGDFSMALGLSSKTDNLGAMAFGVNSRAVGIFSLALGYDNEAHKTQSIAIGTGNDAKGHSSVSIGLKAKTDEPYGVAIGAFPHAKGYNAIAIGAYTRADSSHSISMGNMSYALDVGAISIGQQCASNGSSAISIGSMAKAKYTNSLAIGWQAEADSMMALAIGGHSYAKNYGSISIGTSTANGRHSLAIGSSTANDTSSVAIGNSSSSNAFSTAVGNSAHATGRFATAIGYGNNSTAFRATTLGTLNTASGEYALAMGNSSEAVGNYSVAIGHYSRSYADNAVAFAGGRAGTYDGLGGNHSFAFGNGAFSEGFHAFSFGVSTEASEGNSFAFGWGAKAREFAALSFGWFTNATGQYSFAFGQNTDAAGLYAIAMGQEVKATGSNSLCIGQFSRASAYNAIALGSDLRANSAYSFVVGRFNDTTTTTNLWHATDPLFAIGNGTATNARSNALTVLKNGNTGIGTHQPTQKLDINGLIRIREGSPGLGKVLTSDANGNASWEDISGSNWTLSGSDVYRTTGNVGIGTSSPTHALHLSRVSNMAGSSPGEINGANALLRIQYPTGTNGLMTGIRFNVSSTDNTGAAIAFERTGTQSQGKLHFATKASTVISNDIPIRMTIDQNGNVGIGTTSPLSQLHTTGTVRFAGAGTPGVGKVLTSDASGVATWQDIPGGGSSNWALSGGNVSRSSGFVGIGTTTPSSQLNVVSSSNLASSGSVDLADAPMAIRANFGSGSGQMTGIAFSVTTNTSSIGAGIIHERTGSHTQGKLHFATKSSSTADTEIPIRMTIDQNGNVGIGTQDPSHILHITGQGRSTHTSWAITSDKRLKDIICEYEYGINEIAKLNTYRFKYKEGNNLNLPSDNEFIGLMAQELLEIIPEAVKMNNDGYYTVNTDPIIWSMVNALKEQQQIIETQQKLIENQNMKIEKLEQKSQLLNQYEARFAGIEKELNTLKARENLSASKK